jgi:hypothetical protein
LHDDLLAVAKQHEEETKPVFAALEHECIQKLKQAVSKGTLEVACKTPFPGSVHAENQRFFDHMHVTYPELELSGYMFSDINVRWKKHK